LLPSASEEVMGKGQDTTNTGVVLTLLLGLIFKVSMGSALSTLWKTLDAI